MLFYNCSVVLSAIVYVLARAGSVHNSNCPDLEVVRNDFPVANTKDVESSVFDIGKYREQLLAQSKPYIIECAAAEGGGSQVHILGMWSKWQYL